MKFYMLVLALDTTTRRGSAALLRDGTLLDCELGDAARTHGERLPGDLVRLLDRHSLTVRDVDLFAVAAGPGSLTGLRIGIASMQGLALANSRRMVGISTLDALEKGVRVAEKRGRTPFTGKRGTAPFFVGAWLDAQRGEVFSALYQDDELIDGPSVGKPGEELARWSTMFNLENLTCVGDGALAYANVIRGMMPNSWIVPAVPALAPAVALLAEQAAMRNETLTPDAIRPIYVRRSDVELARDRRASAPGTRLEPGTLSEPGTHGEPGTLSEPGTHREPSTQHQAPRTTAKKP